MESSHVFGPLDLRLKSGSSMQIVGPSQSGKTFLALQIARDRNLVYDKPHTSVVFVYNNYQDTFDQVKARDSTIIFTNDFDELEKILLKNVYTLVIIDDFLLSLQSDLNEYITDFFIRRTHHEKLSLIVLQQSLYFKNSRLMSLNTHYLVLFKLPRDSRQVKYLGGQIDPDSPSFIYECYKLAISKPRGTLLIDLYPTTPDYARFRSSVFVSDSLRIYIKT